MSKEGMKQKTSEQLLKCNDGEGERPRGKNQIKMEGHGQGDRIAWNMRKELATDRERERWKCFCKTSRRKKNCN